MIIGITGKAKSGKDTLAAYLNYWIAREYPYKKIRIVHVADPLKKMCSFLLATNDMDVALYSIGLQNSLSKTKRDKIIEKWNNLTRYQLDQIKLASEKNRGLLQIVGTDIIRDVWAKTWVDLVLDDIQRDDITIIPDIRFNDEAKICDAIIKLERNIELVGALAGHSSENGIDEKYISEIFINIKTVKELNDFARNFVINFSRLD